MAYDYTSFVAALRTMVASTGTDVPFDTILPSCIDYAYERIYRDLNLLSAVEVDNTVTLTASTRDATLPNTFIVINQINVTGVAGGLSVPLTPATREVLDMIWPAGSTPGVPTLFAMTTQWDIVLGPPPDSAYGLEVIGTTHPPVLSASTPTTFISTYLPDLLLAAAMVFMSGYMRNFGAQTSDPAMSSSWEAQYATLKSSADIEELRKRFTASSWSSQPLSSQAQPQRG